MHVWKRVLGFIGAVGGLVARRRRLTVAVVIAALLVGPLVFTGDGEVIALNALGIGIMALTVRRLAGFGRRPGNGDR